MTTDVDSKVTVNLELCFAYIAVLNPDNHCLSVKPWHSMTTALHNGAFLLLASIIYFAWPINVVLIFERMAATVVGSQCHHGLVVSRATLSLLWLKPPASRPGRAARFLESGRLPYASLR